ncbi:MAG: EscU/YscU/HrcU family type III secretion system export apparatus switch protein [Fimbriimonadaceae bacterium]|nr:EscU/YscU/HrcU family type III secretion system export apparatus switch protein [Fimbriimonadaceae bacterium]
MSEKPTGERTEEPTPKRKKDARKKGTVAKSIEIPGAIGLFAIAMMLPSTAEKVTEVFRMSVTHAALRHPETGTAVDTARLSDQIMRPMAGVAIPFLLTLLAIGLVTNFAQVGFVVSTESLKPKFDKINPFKGMQRLFSRRALADGTKATLKMGFFSFLAGQAILQDKENLMALSLIGPGAANAHVIGLVQTILFRISIAWIAIAGLDYFFQRKEVDKQLKMTKDELKREMKEQEGAPEVKQARMARARKLSKGGLQKQVAGADVLVTNPTHFAVALKYERSKMHAPMVVGKGQDLVALRMREIARENGIPIVENRPLARGLHAQCEVGDYVPRDLFGPVAEVLAYVYKTVRRRVA